MFLKNRNIISKMKRSKVTDYAALNSIAIFYISSGKAGIKTGVVLSVFKSRYRFLKIANITSTKAVAVQNQHGLCPNIGCYINLVLKIFLVC